MTRSHSIAIGAGGLVAVVAAAVAMGASDRGEPAAPASVQQRAQAPEMTVYKDPG